MALRIPHLLGTTATVLALAASVGCASTGPAGYGGGNGYGNGYGNAGYNRYGNTCANCGTVTRISVGGASGTTGALIGGLIGAVAGHEVSAHTGGSKGNQNVSAVAGAAAGATVGNAIQKSRTPGYTVEIRMDDGRTVKVTQDNVAGFREGARVRVENGQAYLQ
ncbi:peptidoglycan-associated outer membrane lipoprotein precursor [Thermomonas sp.]|uniref:peptidoglycan-associated outer membrane lipoprotein precursor n=1 Tax=Thermomonas sp. TaxID=1971895 RepID=UPI00391A668A